MIKQAAFASSRGRCARTSSTWSILAQSESLFALSNGHSAARQPRRGRAARSAGQLPERRLRAASAALCRRRLRLARVGTDAHQRHQRETVPTLRRRRAVRRPLWRIAGARPGTRLPRGCPAPPGRVVVAGRAAPSGCRPPGWCRSRSGQSPRSATRCEPVDEPANIVVQSELVANEQLPSAGRDPRVAAVLDRR